MAKNKLGNLNDHLFAELERLSDESLTGENLESEIKRAMAVTTVAREIISCGYLVLKARIAADNTLTGSKIMPGMLDE
ncbi:MULTISPECIES: hypothetical protein [unclassified Desulfovibrio]|uniref:hypothetical protein n=1 Tax=unclassified Desulfovibrio TaxID=2593640 RepID=UPI0013EA51A3|nr:MULTISPECIES: hypothetical protein [unclassified Desulfovibrio]